MEWTWARNYGCNTPAASENLLTFRSGAAGYFDLCNDGGTGNFGGFRSSCTNNLIVAGGVLTAPDYTRTCTCSYQNQTSLALVPMPEAEMWTYYRPSGREGPIRRVGIMLGAPGNRKADDGTLWLEYPDGRRPVAAGAGQHHAGQTRLVPPASIAGRRSGTSVGGRVRGARCASVAVTLSPDNKRSGITRCG